MNAIKSPWNYAVITGASSGIGYEFAKQLAVLGTNLLLISRKRNELMNIKFEFETKYGVVVDFLDVDLSSYDSYQKIEEYITTNDLKPDLLINNAGIGAFGEFLNTEIDKELEIIAVNINSLVFLTKTFLRLMLSNNSGTILNVSSTMAFRKSRYWAVYSSTKSFVLSFSCNLSLEYENSDVIISVLCPGKTQSSFDSNAKVNLNYNTKRASSSKVVAYALSQLLKKKTLIIPGLNNKIKYYIFKYLPEFITNSIIRGI